METNRPFAFVYPTIRQDRRHGPDGYSDLKSFRPWLRDEFAFRCVYCLLREQWSRIKGEFHIDHFVPSSIQPDSALQYSKLVYACAGCNLVKGQQSVADPMMTLTDDTVMVAVDGKLVGLTPDAKRTIEVVGLNSVSLVRWRMMWIRIVELAATNDARFLVEF